MPITVCDATDCANDAEGRRKYCSERCRNRMKSRRRRAKEKGVPYIPPIDGGRRGTYYEQLASSGIGELVAQGVITLSEAALRLDTSRENASRAYKAWQADQKIAAVVDEWTRDADVDHLLGADLTLHEIDELVERFRGFRDRFFRTKRGPYYTEDFHLRWIKAILEAMLNGSNQMILSPPRHGKSELLAHFCVWMISRDHNISILWVGGNEDIAARLTGMVRSQLEHNGELIKAVLPPGQAFRPARTSGKTWTNSIFVVNQQDPDLVKGPTMQAVGRQGKILSMDADLVVCDDIEDHQSVLQPKQREDTRKWFTTQLGSRVEEHTAWFVIGSRQHPDDIYGYLLNPDNQWDSIVDRAHSELCQKSPEDVEAHTDCMLFPRHFTYKTLRKKQVEARALGLEAHWEMVYLNNPYPEGVVVFQRNAIEACYNPLRSAGLKGLPSDYRLVAGLDPSASGYQASFLWAWSDDEQKRYMVDLENRKGGGIEQAFRIFREWHLRYNLSHWVIEENGFQKAIRQDPRISSWAAQNGVRLEGHQTQGPNKHDDMFGVASMARLYDEGLIDLPWQGVETREKTLAYVYQMLGFSDDAGYNRRNRNKSDILMASWFPNKVIARWTKKLTGRQMVVTYDQPFATFTGISDYMGANPFA